MDETFDQMSQTVEGITKLAKLTNIVRANFEPFVQTARSLAATMPHIPPPANVSTQRGLQVELDRLCPIEGGGDSMPPSMPPSNLRNSPLGFNYNIAAQGILTKDGTLY